MAESSTAASSDNAADDASVMSEATVADDIPFEALLADFLWCNIGFFLLPHDLLNLALTCRRFGAKTTEIDGMDINNLFNITGDDGKPQLSMMEYTASELVYGHVHLWVQANLSQFLLYYIIYYNLNINCTLLQCNCEDCFCGMTKFEIRGEFEYDYPFLGSKCSPWDCECGLIVCQIREDDIDDIVDVDDMEEDTVNVDDVADQYLRSMLEDEGSGQEYDEYYDKYNGDH